MSALAGRRECRRRVPSRRGEAVAIGMCGSRAPWLDGGIGRYPKNGGVVQSKIPDGRRHTEGSGEQRCRRIKDQMVQNY